MEHNIDSDEGSQPDPNNQEMYECVVGAGSGDDDDDDDYIIHEPQVIIECGDAQTTDVVWVKPGTDDEQQEHPPQGSYNGPRTSTDNFSESSDSGQAPDRHSLLWAILKRDQLEPDVCLDEKRTNTDDRKRYKCLQCAYRTVHAGHMRAHAATHSEIKAFKCEECAYATSCLGNLKKHSHTHSGLKPYRCTLCAYSCGERASLRRHERTTHSTARPFRCGHAGCQFSSGRADNVRRHEARHTGLKRFRCAFAGCAYKGGSAGDLRKHTATHTGDHRFRCAYAGCAYSSVQAGPMKAHLASHTGVMPFPCAHCDYKTADKSNLTKHVQLKHAVDKKFRCDLCAFSCPAKLTLTRHVKSKHPDSTHDRARTGSS